MDDAEEDEETGRCNADENALADLDDRYPEPGRHAEQATIAATKLAAAMAYATKALDDFARAWNEMPEDVRLNLRLSERAEGRVGGRA